MHESRHCGDASLTDHLAFRPARTPRCSTRRTTKARRARCVATLALAPSLRKPSVRSVLQQPSLRSLPRASLASFLLISRHHDVQGGICRSSRRSGAIRRARPGQRAFLAKLSGLGSFSHCIASCQRRLALRTPRQAYTALVCVRFAVCRGRIAAKICRFAARGPQECTALSTTSGRRCQLRRLQSALHLQNMSFGR